MIYAKYKTVAEIRKCKDCGNREVWTLRLDDEMYIKTCKECGDGPFGDQGYLELIEKAKIIDWTEGDTE